MHSDSPSVLIVRLDAIGDALALVPLLAALHERGARIDAVLRAENADVFSSRALNQKYVASFPLRDASPSTRAQIAELGKRLAAQRYDYALIATEDLAGYRLAWQSHARRRIGFENGWGKPIKTLWARALCTRTIFRTAGLDPRAPHECTVLFQLGRDLVGDATPPHDAATLAPFVIDEFAPRSGRVLMQITDKWERLGASAGDVAALCSKLSARYDALFVASQKESKYAQRIAGMTNIAIETVGSVEPWKNAIANAKAIVAPDSGAVHVAGMVGTPVTAVFAAEHFAIQSARWSPWAAPYRIVKIEPNWPLIAFDALADLIAGNVPIYRG